MPQDQAEHSAAELFSYYAAKTSSKKLAIDATALRTESAEYRKLLTYIATDGKLTYSELRELVLSDQLELVRPHIVMPLRLGSLGRVALLQQFDASDKLFGLRSLMLALELTAPRETPRRFVRLAVEAFILDNDASSAEQLLDAYEDVDQEYYGYLRAELKNPFKFPASSSPLEEWLEAFNQPFVHNGLDRVQLDADGPTPFDRLSGRSNTDLGAHGSPLVSVVLTAYKPQRDSFLTSVRSILEQTWPNLELIIVDDASGEEYTGLFNEVTRLDDRIRLIVCETNRGTYYARNVGYQASQGEFITGQDDDDWSHPQRIQLQVEALLENIDAPGSRSQAISCKPNLSRVRLGYLPEGGNASSLMIRREIFDATGGFLPIRKAADNEFAGRVEAITAESIVLVDKPLAVIRILEDSLSRSHFRPEWQHPSRRQFKSAYRYWHRTAPKQELTLRDAEQVPVPVPRALRQDPNSFPNEVDIVFAADWSVRGVRFESALEEISALKASGYRIGLLHLDSPTAMTISTKPLVDEVQKLINNGTVQELLYDDPVRVGVLVIREPEILQFPSVKASQLQIRRLIVVTTRRPKADGDGASYIVEDCDNNAETVFAQFPLWAPTHRSARRYVSSLIGSDRLLNFDVPEFVDVKAFTTSRDMTRSVLPVVGRCSHAESPYWPDSQELLELYPPDGSYDVRFLGDVTAPLRKTGAKAIPAGWTVFSKEELSLRSFLASLDFYVYYASKDFEESSFREIVAAMASGLVVLLPHRYAHIFGEGAIYRFPREVRGTIREFHADPQMYEAQSLKALSTVENQFSRSRYQRLASTLLAGTED